MSNNMEKKIVPVSNTSGVYFPKIKVEVEKPIVLKYEDEISSVKQDAIVICGCSKENLEYFASGDFHDKYTSWEHVYGRLVNRATEYIKEEKKVVIVMDRNDTLTEGLKELISTYPKDVTIVKTNHGALMFRDYNLFGFKSFELCGFRLTKEILANAFAIQAALPDAEPSIVYRGLAL